jgi:hypothetical protein
VTLQDFLPANDDANLILLRQLCNRYLLQVNETLKKIAGSQLTFYLSGETTPEGNKNTETIASYSNACSRMLWTILKLQSYSHPLLVAGIKELVEELNQALSQGIADLNHLHSIFGYLFQQKIDFNQRREHLLLCFSTMVTSLRDETTFFTPLELSSKIAALLFLAKSYVTTELEIFVRE